MTQIVRRKRQNMSVTKSSISGFGDKHLRKLQHKSQETRLLEGGQECQISAKIMDRESAKQDSKHDYRSRVQTGWGSDEIDKMQN